MTERFDEGAWNRLHEIRLRGTMQVAEDPTVDNLVEAGYLIRRGGIVAVTPTGREAHAQWALLDLESDEYAACRRAYDQFLRLDKQVKDLTTQWQLSTNATADSYSPEDWELIDRLVVVDEKAGPVVSQLGRAVPRFCEYRPRLRKALEQLQGGDGQWFCGARCDSYHTVWWHLHEDLLLALGIARSEDPNQ